jgi:hypothetical protein
MRNQHDRRRAIFAAVPLVILAEIAPVATVCVARELTKTRW